MFDRIALISIPVTDQQVSESFYTEKLGCRVVQDMPFGTDGHTRWIRLALPGVETQIVLVTWFPQMQPGCIQGLVLVTSDIASDMRSSSNGGWRSHPWPTSRMGKKRPLGIQTATDGCYNSPRLIE